ncbi:DUF6768 family protein [Agaribacter flavus]|uniref:DUF6768 family protein n=1 Tax=Agaribacter flavus TaxID=1902781 RepID=A0ABV7FNU8_9ALTE
MNKLDQKLLDAIRDSAEKQDESIEEQANALQLIVRSFKGSFRLTFAVVVLIQIVCAGFAVYFAYQMFHEADLAIKLNWLAGVIVASIAFGIARLFFFMELNRLSVIREIKRVELQLSVLANAIDDRPENA